MTVVFPLPNQNVIVFNSLEFIFRILPVSVLLCALVPGIGFSGVLLFLSLLLYWMADPSFIWLLLAVWLINYMLAWWMGCCRGKTGRRLFLILSVFCDFGLLFGFKFSLFPFLTGSGAIPLGISFYIFRAVSYTADVYTGKIPPELSPFKLCIYLYMFPVMASGPITRYGQISGQLKKNMAPYKVEEGLHTFIVGLAFKVLLADRIGILWHEIQVIGFESISTPLAWMGAFAYTLMLYFDFNGYSLMAMGVGKMLGFTLPENFRYPYAARSFTQFWRRWHITLSSWFRDYVYIPLGGSRKGRVRTCLNLLAVWLLTGIWHGNGWNFLLWGLLLWLLLTAEKLFLRYWLEEHGVWSRLYMLFLIPVTWIVFAVTDLKELAVYLSRMFPVFGPTQGNVNGADFIKYGKMFWPLFLFGWFFSRPWAEDWYKKTKKNPLWMAVLLAVFWICIYNLVNTSGNPFLYFSF